MSKNLSAKCYQENKEGPQKKACERYQNLFKEKKSLRTFWTLWFWTLQKTFRRWKTKASWVYKKYRMRKNTLLQI